MHRTTLVLLALPCFGCSCLETGGNSNGGRFYAPLPSALVATTSYDLPIFDYEFERNLATDVSAASSADDSIARASVLSGGAIKLEAAKPGSFVLDFTAEADGDPLADSFEIRVIDPVRVELAHLCDAAYVADHPADVQFWFSDANRFQGNGYGWYPVVVDGATLDENASTAHTLRIQLGDTSATVTSSLAPDNELAARLALDVVPFSAIDGVRIIDQGQSRVINGRRIEEGEELAIRVVPAMGERALCGSLVPSEVTVSEDSDCMLATFRGSEDLQRTLATNGETILVVAVSYGLCQLTASLIDEGLSEVLELDLTEPPSSGSSDFD